MSGLELQAKLKDEQSRIPIIFITAHGDGEMRMQAMCEGAVEFLTKPFDEEVLLDTVRAATLKLTCLCVSCNTGPTQPTLER